MFTKSHKSWGKRGLNKEIQTVVYWLDLLDWCLLVFFVALLLFHPWAVMVGVCLRVLSWKAIQSVIMLGSRVCFSLIVPPRDLRLVVGGKWLYWYIFASLTFCSYNVSSYITGSQKIMNLSLFQKQYTSVKGQSHFLIKVKDKIEKKNKWNVTLTHT